MSITSNIVKLSRGVRKLSKKVVASPANVAVSRRTFLKILLPAAAQEVKSAKSAVKRAIKLNAPQRSTDKTKDMLKHPNKLISRREFLKGSVSAPLGNLLAKKGSKALTTLVNPRKIFRKMLKETTKEVVTILG